MKKIFLLLFVLCFVIPLSASPHFNRSLYKNHNTEHWTLRSERVQLELLESTVDCPAGYTGAGITYWIVYDPSNGTIVGSGTYDQCYPTQIA